MLRAIRILFIVMLAGFTPAAAHAAPAVAEKPASPPPSTLAGRIYPPAAPGRLVDVGGRRLHILCKGASATTVMFEAGLSQYTATPPTGSRKMPSRRSRACARTIARAWGGATRHRRGLDAGRHGGGPAQACCPPRAEPGPYVDRGAFPGRARRSHVRPGLPAGGCGPHPARCHLGRRLRRTRHRARRHGHPQLNAAIGAAPPRSSRHRDARGTSPEVVLAFTPEMLRGVKVEFEALDRLPAESKRPGGFGDLGDLPLHRGAARQSHRAAAERGGSPAPARAGEPGEAFDASGG